MFDTMTARRLFLFWFVFGTLSMAAIQFADSMSLGGYSGLLRAAEHSTFRHVVETQLPNLPELEGIGHDGHVYFVQGLDPFGMHESADGVGAYRFRRVAYPALASLGGLLGGELLLAGMVIVASVCAGLACGAAAVLARDFGATPWLAMAVALNPGVWLSGELLTADVMALASGLLGILAYLRGKLPMAILAFVVAALAKETAFLFMLGAAGHALSTGRRRNSAILAAGVSVPVLLWLWRVRFVSGNAVESTGQIGLPFFGLFEASAQWPRNEIEENLLLGVLLIFMGLGIWGLRRVDVLWRWLTWPWIGLALVASHPVWDLGNNAIRAFAPIITLTVLGLAVDSAQRHGRRRAPLNSASP